MAEISCHNVMVRPQILDDWFIQERLWMYMLNVEFVDDELQMI
jgi:hypothetical protein